MTSVRLVAAEVLLAIERGRTTLAAEIDRRRPGLSDPRDRGLLLELAAGTLRWRDELDALIAAASRRSVRTIDPQALAVLRLAVYQLRHLERIPPHAVVHESVEAVRSLGSARAAGFVNAVLRAVIRRGPALSLPRRPPEDASDAARIRYLSTTLSHPAWLVSRWLHRFGFEATERWCRFNNTSPSVTVRSRDRSSSAALLAAVHEAGFAAAPAPFAPGAIRLEPGVLGQLPAPLRSGLFVQDEGAQIVAAVARVEPGEQVLDVCAAPGGKTLILADNLRMGEPAAESRLVAADFRPNRVALLADVLKQAGCRAPVVRLDARAALPFGPVFDCALADVPCSGLGTLRRDPDLKWTRTESGLSTFAREAQAILTHAAAVVRPGGRLVYATCSSEPEENEEVVRAFLEASPEFTRGIAEPRLPHAATLVDARGHLATRPFRDELDAFFAAVLVRQPAA